MKRPIFGTTYACASKTPGFGDYDLHHTLLPAWPPFGLQESWGIRMTSSIRPMRVRGRASARMAAWAPGPGLRFCPAQVAHLDMDADDPLLRAVWATFKRPSASPHGRALVPVLLDDHAAAALGHGLRTREVGDGDDRVVEGRKDVGDAPLFLLVCRHCLSPSSSSLVPAVSSGYRLGVGHGFCNPYLLGVGVGQERGRAVVGDLGLLGPVHTVTGDFGAPATNRDVPVGDELPGPVSATVPVPCGTEGLQAAFGLGLHFEREDVFDVRVRAEKASPLQGCDQFGLLVLVELGIGCARTEGEDTAGTLAVLAEHGLGLPDLALVPEPYRSRDGSRPRYGSSRRGAWGPGKTCGSCLGIP